MKIKLIKQIQPNYSPIEQVLYNRGIPEDKFKDFINLNYKFYHYSQLINIDKAVACLKKHIENKSKIYCIVDSDCDGFTSAASLMCYITKNFPDINIDYIMHPEKAHGIFIEEIPDDCNLLISPDGGSGDIEQQEILYNKGIDVIVLDHHEYDINAKTHAIIVNSMNNYPNPYLCGVGIVYKFLEALDDEFNLSNAEDYIDLCALGLIADMMSLTNIETLSLINKGLLNLNNEFFRTLIEKQSFVMKNEITPTSVAFYIVPLINATIRMGLSNEKKSVFEAFLYPNKQVLSTKRGCAGQSELIKDQAYRYMGNCKSRQDKEVAKQEQKIEEIIERDDLLNNKILIVVIDFDINKNIIGLIANRLAAKYNKPTMILKKYDDKLSGSGRNPKFSEIEDLRKIIDELYTAEYAKGHSSAFGVGIASEKLNDFICQTNEIFGNVTYENTPFVDFNFNGQCKVNLIKELNKYKYLFGQGISEPLIAIYNLKVNKSNCSIIGKLSDTIKIVDPNNICYMFFRQKSEVVNKFLELLSQGDFMINLVGRGSINEWNGRITEQLIVDAFEISENPVF